MNLKTLINTHLSATGESPDSLAAKSGVSRASIFRAKNGKDVRMSIALRIANAIGGKLVYATPPIGSPAHTQAETIGTSVVKQRVLGPTHNRAEATPHDLRAQDSVAATGL